ncbi:tRNA(Glu)-specific nuclease WapA precursor [Gimesia alba]|uniref:tRNA(Glu)-specific nuclease WapA n=1 Tax=Gimesia alba TaxID=2527973 RepID=A0A517R998_9PLAN|nr:RHS repeat-associated core domain-containing protein [Gimesia alba]QDT40363.1 tRNA(Glu)-specific nuclease WapA precursor [Gimesia alba]
MSRFLFTPQVDGSTGGSFSPPGDGQNIFQPRFSYQSTLAIDGVGGLGFIPNFDASIIPFEPENGSSSSSSSSSSSEINIDNVLVILGDGGAYEFNDKDSNGNYTSSNGTSFTLRKNLSGWTLSDLVQNKEWTFNEDGCLVEINQSGSAWQINRKQVGVLSVPDTIVGPYGLCFTFEYNEDPQPHIVTIIDSSNRKTKLSYEESKLKTFTPAGGGTYTISYEEDSSNITAIEKPSGNITSYAYDEDSRVISLTYPIGTRFTFTYPASNKQVVIDPNHRRTTVTYDDIGNITSTEKNGQLWSYPYDNGYPAGMVSPSGIRTSFSSHTGSQGEKYLSGLETGTQNVASYKYYSNNRLRGWVNWNGARTTLTHDSSGNINSIQSPNGSRITCAYDSNGLQTSTVNPLGYTRTNVYDSDGNPISTISPSRKRTSFSYNQYNQVATKTSPMGLVSSFSRNENNLLISETNPTGERTTYSYNQNGNPIRSINPLGLITTSVYDVNQRVIATISPMGTRVTIAYDSVSKPIRTESPSGLLATTVYDNLWRPIAKISPMQYRTTTLYDINARPIATIDPLNRITTNLLDNDGRVIAKVDASGFRTTFAYDADGNQISVTNPDLQSNLSIYSSSNNLLASVDALGNRTSFSYDALGRQIRTTNPLGYVTTNVYNSDDLVIATIDPLNYRTTTVYDDDNRAIAIINPLGDRTTTVFDNASRPIATIDPLGNRTTTSYDAAGRAIAETNPLNESVTTVYNANGKVVATVDPLGNTTSFSYDLDGNRITTINPLGEITTSVYNDDGNEIATINPLGYRSTHVYDDAGQKIAEVSANGDRTTTIYNLRGLISATIDPLGYRTSTTYDAIGQKISTINADGEITTTVYDAAGQQIATINALGYRSTSVYDAAGQAIRTIDALNQITTTAYDAAGRAIAITDPLNEITTTTYDAAGQAIASINPLNEIATTVYDSAGRTVVAIDALGARTTTVYDLAGRSVASINPLGEITTTVYDAAGHTIASINPEDERTTTVYDSAGQEVASIDGLGERSTTVYDPAGRSIASINPLLDRTTTSYDAAGRAVASINPLNEISTTVYDSAGRTIASVNPLLERTTTVYDAVGQEITEIDPLGYRTSTTYDAIGQKISTINADGEITTTVYDAVGQETAEINALGYRSTSVYDAAGQAIRTIDALNQITTTAYDAAGRAIAITDPLNEITTTTYDAAGQAIASINPLNEIATTVYDSAGRTVVAIDALGARTTTVYDLAGRSVASINPLGEITTTVYDAAGHTIAEVNANGFRTTSILDQAGQVSALQDARNNRISFLYDAMGREIVKINPLQDRKTTIYDSAGRINVRIDAEGIRTSYVYDAVGRKTQRHYPDGARTTWTYDAIGNPLVINSSEGAFTRTYDSLNQVRSLTWPAGKRVTWTYDAIGQRSIRETFVGRTTYTYDVRSKLTTLINEHNERTTFSYDSAGREIQKQLANGTRTSMVYDAAGRETHITHFTSGNVPFSSFADTYGASGNRTQRINLDGDITTWTYDSTSQVLSERYTDSIDTTITTFVYDAVGNRLVKEDNIGITTSTYDAANRLQNSEESSGISTYIYDKDGNQRSIEDSVGDITTYSWTYENQLANVESPNGDIVTYTYAPVNKKSNEYRLSKETDLEYTSYMWDDQNIILELDEIGTIEAEYTVVPQAYGNLISQERDTESSFYHFDPLGSTSEITDDTETVTDSYLYDVFGEVKSSTGTTINPYQWIGKEGYYRDSESGLYSLRNRIYGADEGRFKSEDPLGFAAGDINLYRYAGNNAATLTDPSGLHTIVTNQDPRFPRGVWLLIEGPNCGKGTKRIRIGTLLESDPTKFKPDRRGANEKFWNCEVSLDTATAIAQGEFTDSSFGQHAWTKSDDFIRDSYLSILLPRECNSNDECSDNSSNDEPAEEDTEGLCYWINKVCPILCNLSDLSDNCLGAAGVIPNIICEASKLGLGSLREFYNLFEAALGCVYEKIKANIEDLISGILGRLSGLDINVGDLLSGNWSAIASAIGLSLQNLARLAWQVAGTVFDKSTGIIQWIVDMAITIVQTTIDCIFGGSSSDSGGFLSCILGKLGLTGEKIKEVVQGAIDAFNEFLKDPLGTLLKNILGVIQDFVLNLISGIIGKLCNLGELIKDGCSIVKGIFEGFLQALRCFNNGNCSISQICNILYRLITAAIEALIAAIVAGALGKNVLCSIKKAICNFKCMIENAIKKALKWVMEKLKSLFPQGPPDECKSGNCALPVACDTEDTGGQGGGNTSGGNCETKCRKCNAGNCFGAGTLVHTPQGTQAIETLCIGQRVKTYLPDERTGEVPYEPTSLEWAAHRVITLTLPCLDDETIHLQLLRDPDWFRLHQPEVGETLWLDMPEMGVEGEALVEAIDDCPEIETGSGRVITATFAHSTGECLEFDIEGESTPLRVTGGHPLWRETAAETNLEEELTACCNSLNAAVNSSCGCESPSIYSLPVETEKKQAFASLATAVREITLELMAPKEQTWVPADEFQPGDSLKSLNGLRQFTNRNLERTPERVYNIEVDGDHVYRVGQSGMLVHNASEKCPSSNQHTQCRSKTVDVSWYPEPITVSTGGTAIIVNDSARTNLDTPPWWGKFRETPPYSSSRWQQGHVIASRFGGQTGSCNFTPQYSRVNLSGYKTCENRIGDALGCGCIKLIITINYGSDPLVPESYTIKARGMNGNKFKLDAVVDNDPNKPVPSACKKK